MRTVRQGRSLIILHASIGDDSGTDDDVDMELDGDTSPIDTRPTKTSGYGSHELDDDMDGEGTGDVDAPSSPPDLTFGGSLPSATGSSFTLQTPPSSAPSMRAMMGMDKGTCKDQEILKGGVVQYGRMGLYDAYDQVEIVRPESPTLDSLEGGEKGMEQHDQKECLLLRSPPEILHRVMCHSGVGGLQGLSRMAETCKELHGFVYKNTDQALWRDVFLQLYDDPRRSASIVRPDSTMPLTGKVDWKGMVQGREMVKRVFLEWSEERYPELPGMLDTICETLLGLYLDLPPLSDERQDDTPTQSRQREEIESLNADILEPILRSPAFDHLTLRHSTRTTRPHLRPLSGQMGNPLRRITREAVSPVLSRLHALLPPTLDENDAVHATYRGYLRELVYSAINFKEENDWAPLKTDGRVDWVLVDAISSIMMANAKDVLASGETSWRPAIQPLSYGLDAVRGWGYTDLVAPDLEPGQVWDWAGVEGKWCGSYAFLDYADWITLNEPRIVMLRRSLADLDLSHYHEAVGDLLQMELIIDRPTSESEGGKRQTWEDLPKVISHLPTNPLLPPIHFHGSSAQATGELTHPSGSPHSFVRGTVQLTADNPPEVRWTIVIRYGGEDRWKVEGVQVGGRGSKRGFFGVWTDAAKEEHSPNGPAWYWKV